MQLIGVLSSRGYMQIRHPVAKEMPTDSAQRGFPEGAYKNNCRACKLIAPMAALGCRLQHYNLVPDAPASSMRLCILYVYTCSSI